MKTKNEDISERSVRQQSVKLRNFLHTPLGHSTKYIHIDRYEVTIAIFVYRKCSILINAIPFSNCFLATKNEVELNYLSAVEVSWNIALFTKETNTHRNCSSFVI